MRVAPGGRQSRERLGGGGLKPLGLWLMLGGLGLPVYKLLCKVWWFVTSSRYRACRPLQRAVSCIKDSEVPLPEADPSD